MNNFEDSDTSVMDPIYVFSGAVDPEEFLKVQLALVDRMGVEAYLRTQLYVLYRSMSRLILSVRENPESLEVNTNVVGHA